MDERDLMPASDYYDQIPPVGERERLGRGASLAEDIRAEPRWRRLRRERRQRAAERRALMRGRREVQRTWQKEDAGELMSRDAEAQSVQVYREPEGGLYAAATMGTMVTFIDPYVVIVGHCEECDQPRRLCGCIPF